MPWVAVSSALLPFKYPADQAEADDIYAKPSEFIPERWYILPDLIKKEGAFFPFSLGE